MQGKTYGTRPIHAFTMSREWVACNGSEEIGPRRMFSWEAVGDLPPEAEVTYDLFHSYNCAEPYGVRPVHTEFFWVMSPERRRRYAPIF
jgi:hypothetical protein